MKKIVLKTLVVLLMVSCVFVTNKYLVPVQPDEVVKINYEYIKI